MRRRPRPHALLPLLLLAAIAPALAAPPDPPLLVSPEEGESGIPALAPLCVEVSDPDGELLDLIFRGRRVTGEDFTIVALPDTQYYSCAKPEIFESQTQWIVDNREERNIVFVTHLGDVVELASNLYEWDSADQAMGLLEDPLTTQLADGIPYGLAPGNHDQDREGKTRDDTDEGMSTENYNLYFGKHRFEDRAYYGGNFDFGDADQYGNNNDNNWELFTAAGMDFLWVHLEYDKIDCPQRDAVLDWLDNLVMTHPGRRVMITTHHLLDTTALFSDQGQAIYEKIKDNPNVFLMHGGHVDGAARRTDVFEHKVIHSVLADYQNHEERQSGYLRIMTFRPEEDEILFETFSPWHGGSLEDEKNRFTLSYPMDGPLPFLQIGGVIQRVPSGSVVCADWPGRRAGTAYEWFVEARDRESGTPGPAWRFSSDGGCGADADCLDVDECSADLCEAGTCRDVPPFDGDGDRVCEAADNCPRSVNPAQRDTDGDGLGDLCDSCPETYDPVNYDDDGDGQADSCDPEPADTGDRLPAQVLGVLLEKLPGGSVRLSWGQGVGADTYAVTRGLAADLRHGNYGECLAQGILGTSLEDSSLPEPGEIYFYLVQGRSFDCGEGTLGYRWDERRREDVGALTCPQAVCQDIHATSETPVLGYVQGSLADTMASDDLYEKVTEQSTPPVGVSRLEHRWTVEAVSGRRLELHLEAYRTISWDDETIVFEHSLDGGLTWLPLDLPAIPTEDRDVGFVAELPPEHSGPILVRAIDTDHSEGLKLDTIAVDELFVRVVP